MKDKFHFFTRIPSDVLLLFYSDFSFLLENGSTVYDVLETVSKTSGCKTLRESCSAILCEMRSGVPFYKTAYAHREVFPDSAAKILRLGDETGSYIWSFHFLCSELKRKTETARTLRSLTAYPIAIFTFIFLTMMFIFPLITGLFGSLLNSFSVTLPPFTEFLLTAGQTLSTIAFPLLIAFALIIVTLYIIYRKCYRFSLFVDRFVLRLPMMGRLLTQIYSAGFSRCLSLLLTVSCPYEERFSLLAAVSNNRYRRKAVAECGNRIRNGESLSGIINDPVIFSPFLINTVKTHDGKPTLPKALDICAEMLEKSNTQGLSKLYTVSGYALITVAGGAVLLLALSLFLPLSGVYESITF